jgi:site-specific DNA recombinase
VEAKVVGIWIRVSTEDQVRGESPEHHEKRARAYAEAKGWRVAELYRLDAVSGKAVMGHPEAQRMLADIRAKKINGLVFSKLARLARNTKELLDFADVFRAEGADLISLQESIDTSSPAGRLFFTMIAAMAQWEREEIAERVAASVPIRAKMGKPTGGAATFGYRWRDKRLEPDPDEAPIRALIYDLFLEYRRRRTVAAALNQRGYRTRRGDLWTGTTIDRLLSDSTAKGIHRANYTKTSGQGKAWALKPTSDWVETAVEPVVSTEVWDRCAAICAEQKSQMKPISRQAVHIFAGLAHCACGTKMYVRSGYPKYVCDACRNKIPAADLEKVFTSQLHRFILSPDELDAHARAANEAVGEREKLVAAAEAELKKLYAEDDRLYNLYQAGGLTTDDFGRRHGPLSARRNQLEDELPRLQAQLDVMRINASSHEETLLGAMTLRDRWPSLDQSEKRQMVEATIGRITIGKEEVEFDLLYLPTGLPAGSSDKSATLSHGFIAATSCSRAG